jgi:hypothetical protein
VERFTFVARRAREPRSSRYCPSKFRRADAASVT